MVSLKYTHYYSGQIILLLLVTTNQYQLKLDVTYSPPAIIPTDPHKMKYSVPLNEVGSYPIIAYFYFHDGSKMEDDRLNDFEVTVTSLPHKINDDKWKLSGGQLCQNTNANVSLPQRLNRSKYFKTCGFEHIKTSIGTKILNGVIIMDWLSHEHTTLPATDRIYRIEVPYLKVGVDTHPFRITTPAAKLVITKQPPAKITANTGFTVEAEIRDTNNKVVTSGLDSIAFVQLTIPYEYKSFYYRGNLDMILRDTKVRLAGSSTMIDQSTHDTIIRKQAVKGKVSFSDVRILDVTNDLQLNLTMYMARDPWLRIPNCKHCHDDFSLKEFNADNSIIKFKKLTLDILNNIPSIALTKSFSVTPQTLKSLTLVHNLIDKIKYAVPRNFPLPGNMKIIAKDLSGNRIYSGPDSKVDIKVTTKPPGITLSLDFTKVITEGMEELRGSICEIRNDVHLIISTNKDPNIKVKTPVFNVVGDINIGHLGNFDPTNSMNSHYILTDTFIKLAASEIQQGIITELHSRYKMSIVVNSFNTYGKSETSVQILQFYKSSFQDTGKELRAFFLSTQPSQTHAIFRSAITSDTPVLTVNEKDDYFTYNNLFNKICYGWTDIYSFFLQACKTRNWDTLSIIRSIEHGISNEFFDMAHMIGINIKVPVVVPEFDSSMWTEDVYGEAMRALKVAGTRIIVCFASRSLPYILRSGIRFGVSALDGYQWLFVSDYARFFPIFDEGVCQWEPRCTVAYRGSLLFVETYNYGGFSTDLWLKTLEKYYSIELLEYLLRKTKYPDDEMAPYLALGYDGLWLLAEAISHIVSENMTAYGTKIASEMKVVNFIGLSGIVRLNEHGQRLKFYGDIIIINPIGDPPITDPNLIALPIRLVFQTHKGNEQLELNYKARYPLISQYGFTLPPIALPVTDSLSTREYISRSGMVVENSIERLPSPNEPWPSILYTRQEYTVTVFHCSGGCGYSKSSIGNTFYRNGICVGEEQCKCNEGYFGISCEWKICNCKHGHCYAPKDCKCYNGWEGEYCEKPICESPCSHGICIKPNSCQCDSYLWVGQTCSLHLVGFFIPGVIGTVVLIILTYLLIRSYIKRAQLRTALANLEWVVDWDDVAKFDSLEGDSKSASAKVTRMCNDLYTWKREKWFVKRLNCRTIDIIDGEMRLEMVELTSLNHKNLIVYGGACLTYPNVSFFLEPANKGSLEDILINDAIQLGWNFRFSFLKDICCGMDFIHSKTNIGSHGRLKSSNCLLDNRWCIRLSGFGCPSIRYGEYLLSDKEENWETERSNMNQLLWTAPELLGNARCLNDVRKGTKEGDVYSFGILVTEIVTRDIPFAFERLFLPVSAILDLIVENNSPDLEAERNIWQDIGGEIFIIRPQLKMEDLPEGKETRIKFVDMLNEVWNDTILARPTFAKLISVLDDIHPTEGELMDNLIRLLESYSNNLEHIVDERTLDLEREKAKIDHILSQMLPKKVVEELKQGKQVQPENFDCVTVFYSDIVGFTTIAKNSQPMQVVDLLNNLYSTFDAILNQHDVYKVETIGDAYVVASGVPERNGNLHAGEITTCAIELVIAMLAVKVPHLPDCVLAMRIGIHSGPVVAGIVGLKMPRYTLFGDTMLIAATMESSSEPFRIQMSENTVKILNELGGYQTSLRGEMTVAGRILTTYWLVSKEGYELLDL